MDIEEIVNKIEALKLELPEIYKQGVESDNRTLAWERLSRWMERASKTVISLLSPAEGEKLKNARPRVFSMADPWGNLKNEINAYEAHLTALIEEIKTNPEFVIAPREQIGKETISMPSPLARLEKICRRFHKVAKQLRDRYSGRETIRIEDEYDVQDLFHALLRIEFDDIRPEEWNPSYAGSSSRTDFLLKQEKVVVEIKKTRSGLEDKEIGDQLILDIDKYTAHPDCKSLVCFIYDPEGRIGNPQGIIRDLEEKHKKDLDLRIIIEPEA